MSASALLRRFSRHIYDYMNNSAYKQFKEEVLAYFDQYGGSSKESELGMFRTLFCNEVDTSVPLPLIYDNHQNCVCSNDSKYMAVWGLTEISVISIVCNELLFSLHKFNAISGVFFSPDSKFIVVLEKTNFKIFTIKDHAECFNYETFNYTSYNPFEDVSGSPKESISISKVKFSFFEKEEAESYKDFIQNDDDKIEQKYKLVVGDSSLIYVFDIKLVTNGVSFTADGKVEKFNIQDYFLLESADFLFTYIDLNDSSMKYIVAVTESKGNTKIRRWKLLVQTAQVQKYGNFNRIELMVDREDTLQGAFTFQYAEATPFRVGGSNVAVYNSETQAVYKCNLSTPFGFISSGGAHAFLLLHIGFASKDFKQIILNDDKDFIISSHESLEFTVWKKKGEDWSQQFLDTSNRDEYTMWLTPNSHYLLIKTPLGIKILPLGFDLQESKVEAWLPEVMNAPLEYNGFRCPLANTVVIDDMDTCYMIQFDHENTPKLKQIFEAGDGLNNPKIKNVKRIRGSSDYWILVTESLTYSEGSQYRLFVYNSNSGKTLESLADLTTSTLRVDFNFDGKYAFIGDGPQGGLASNVDRVRVFSYEKGKEVHFEHMNCTCVVLKDFLYVMKEDLIKIVDLTTGLEKKVIENKFSVLEFNLEVKVFKHLDYLVVFGFKSLTLIDTDLKTIVGSLRVDTMNGISSTRGPYGSEVIEITRDKKHFIAGDRITGVVIIHQLPTFEKTAEFKMNYFDSLCVTSDSNYLFLVFDFEKEIVVYSLAELQTRAKISTDFSFNGTGTVLKHAEFSAEENNILLYYQRQNCIIQVKLPFSQTIAFNAMFRIYPSILRYFSTRSISEKETLTNEIIQTLLKAGKHIPQLLRIFTVAIYHMNQPGLFRRYAETFLSLNELCELHDIWRLALHTYKINSLQCFTDMFQEYISTSHCHPHIDDLAVRDFITDKNEYLSNTLYRYLLRKLLFWRREGEHILELKDPLTTVTYIPQIANRNDAIATSIETLQKKQPQNLTCYTCTETLVNLDFGNGSEFSAIFFDIVNRLPESEIRDYYQAFVRYKWNKIFKFALIYSILYWIMNMMAYLYNGFYFTTIPLGITLSILNILFLLFELKCAFADYKMYLRSVWNWTDLAIHTLSIATVYSLMGASDPNNDLTLAWLRVINVGLLSFRGITMLRVFKQTRYLITMLLQVFLDVIPFIVVLAFVIIIYIYVWFVIDFFGEDIESTSGINYYESIKVAFNTFFGQYPTDDLTVFEFVMIALGNVFLALVLGNFIIALISSTYERISEEKELYDVKDVISMISDFDAFLKGFIRRKSHIWKSFIALFPKYEKSEDLRKTISVIEDNRNLVLARVNENTSKLQGLETGMKKMEEGIHKKVGMFESVIDVKLDRLQRKLEEMMSKAKGQTSFLEDEMPRSMSRFN